MFQLDLQTLVIDRLVKPAAFVFINLEAGADDGVAFLFVNEIRSLFFSCHFVCFVGWSPSNCSYQISFGSSAILSINGAGEKMRKDLANALDVRRHSGVL